jgi:uncharacterized protein YcfJ
MSIKTITSLVLLGILSVQPSFAADSGAVVGGAVGGALGAAIGHDANGRNGAIVGAAIGGATGAAIGASNTQSHTQTTVVKERVVVQQPYPVVRQKVVYVQDGRGHKHGKHKHKGWHKKDRHHYKHHH